MKFEQNNQTIQDASSQETMSDEELEQFTQALAENVTDLLLRGPLTQEQAAAIDHFVKGS